MNSTITLWSGCWVLLVVAIGGLLTTAQPPIIMACVIVAVVLVFLWVSGAVLLIIRGVEEKLNRPRDSTEVS